MYGPFIMKKMRKEEFRWREESQSYSCEEAGR